MGLGFGALGFLLVVAVRGTVDDEDERPLPPPTEVADAGDAAVDGDRPTKADGASAADGGPSTDAAADAESAPAAPPAPPPPPPVFRVASLAGDSSLTLADGTLGHRPFLTALAAAGVGLKECYRVLRAIGKVRNMNHTSPTDAFHVAKEKGSGHVVAFEYVTSPVDVFQARDEGGVLAAKKLELHLDTRHLALLVKVGADLKASVVKAGFDEEILKSIDDALDGHAELADIHPGARLRVLAVEQRLEGALLRYASVDAVEYLAADAPLGAAPLRVYRFPPFDPDKTGATRAPTYYDAKGQQPYHGGWRIPVPSARIASRFNPHRMHPTLHVVMPHNGVDFAAPTGTPIYAAASGTVKTAGDSGPCGNMVQIEHSAPPNSLISSYCHMSRFAAGIHVGEHVETRQLIGYVGQTGRATGPHLHFAIKKNGVFIDPLAMKLDGVRVVPPSQRDEFDELRATLDKALDAIAAPPAPAPVPPAAPATGDGGPPVATDAGAVDAAVDAPPDAAPEEIFDDPAIP
jgi:murein DD-endopeptidase MepM/ murein hydrolase activator NlpD